MSLTVAPAAKSANRRLAASLVMVVLGSLVFVSVQPRFYRAICEWTGIYDIDRPDKASSTHATPRPIQMEFDANTHESGLRFRPEMATMATRTGDIVNMTYRVENTRDTTVIGQAIPSYGPKHAGAYVKKLDCFCFKQQTFAPHEIRDLPVVFFLDTAIPEDIGTVTLSYTFFEVPAGSVTTADAPKQGKGS